MFEVWRADDFSIRNLANLNSSLCNRNLKKGCLQISTSYLSTSFDQLIRCSLLATVPSSEVFEELIGGTEL